MVPHVDTPIDRTIAAVGSTRPLHAHPVLVFVVAALAVASTTGYIIHQKMSQLASATTAGAPVIEPGSAEREIAAGDNTVIWRDKAGRIYRTKIDGGGFDQFLRRRRAALETARTESRKEAATAIQAALMPVFGGMKALVPGYADWYFNYTTKYELMGHALVPAFDYLAGRLDGSSRRGKTLTQAIAAHIVDYIEEQYAERVVRPHETAVRIQAAFDQSYDALHAYWRHMAKEQHAAIGAFIDQHSGGAEALSADRAAGLKLDWDGSGNDGSAMHKEGVIERSFRRGLVSVKLTIPKSAGISTQRGISENNAADADAIAHVIVNLFDKLAGPVVSQMGDLIVGAFAGSVAGGTTVGFGMVVAPAVGTAVPIGAAIGVGTTVVAEMLSNRLEEALTRAEFEENLRQTVDATENAIKAEMIAVLHQHIEAWYADIDKPADVK